MKKTENYAMPYPEQDDYFNVEDFQDMMVSVDNLMKKISDSGSQISSDAEHLYNQTKAQMDNIQKRMNTFTSLKDGSTTGDAELEDIRVAYDGKEYGNAGEAVREQASDIHKAIFGAGASIWSKAKSESTKYVAETKGICILNERFTAAGVVTKISRGIFAENESTLNLDRECSAYIVEFEKNPGTVYMPSAETVKIVSTTKIIFEANGNARCWIPVEKGQYLAVDSTATAYTSESNHVPYMLYDQANKTLECRGFGSTGSIEPVDPYSLALEYKLEYDMDDTGLVKQIDANREAAASLKEDIVTLKTTGISEHDIIISLLGYDKNIDITVTPGRINTSDGNDVEDSLSTKTAYIDTHGANLLQYNSNFTSGFVGAFYYDAKNKFIAYESSGEANNSYSFSIPLFAKYVRLSFVYISDKMWDNHTATAVLKNATDNITNLRGYDLLKIEENSIAVSKSVKTYGSFYDLDSVKAPFDNADTLPNGSVVSYGAFKLTTLKNFPAKFEYGCTILTLNGTNINDSKIQIAVSRNGQICSRMCSDGNKFTDWMYPVNKTIKQYMTMSIFQDFGVIGDSYASGAIYNNTDETWIQNYAISWGQVLARMIGATCINYSTGGLTTRTWLTDAKGLTKLNSNKPNQLYFLNLGINDVKLGIDYIGAESDLDNPDEHDTFYGNMGKIINAIKNHAPKSKIVISEIIGWQNNTNEYNKAIHTICTHYNYILLRAKSNDYFGDTIFWTSQIKGHPIASTYSGMAIAYKEMLEDEMYENVTLFTNLADSEYL